MKKSLLGTNVVVQIGILVNDIEKTSQAYADFLGVDKPEYKMTGLYNDTMTKYRNKPTEARAKLSFFEVGENLQIELIEPDEKPSTWRESLDANGEGFHHIAFRIEGMGEKVDLLTKNDMPLLQSGEYPGGRYAYIDAGEDLKVIVELLEND